MKCECAASGFCPRRNAHVPASQWRKCQSGLVEQVDEVIEKLQASRRKIKKMQRLESLQQRIERRKLTSKRAKEWIMFFKKEPDTGLGDTISRILKTVENDRTKVELRKRLRAITSECSCSRTKAIARLNEQYPYQEK